MTDDDEAPASGPPATGTQRLDKWLWFARVARTRTLAAALVTEGRVRLNRERVTKASQPVRAGDVVTVTVGHRVRVLEVVAPGERRGGAPEAQTLFRDLTPRPEPTDGPAPTAGGAVRAPGSGRPTKRDRRALDRLVQDHDD
jgi:ribosome-associated heat shock protein Hsp15